MRGWKLYLSLIVGAVLVLGAIRFVASHFTDLADARADLKAVQADAEAQITINKEITDYAERLVRTADSAEQVAERAELRAERAEGRLEAAKTAADSLPPAIAAKDAWHDAYTSELAAAGALRARGDTLEAANKHLAILVRDYGDASKGILDATRPSFLKSLLPNVGVGAAVGINPLTRKPASVIGLTLSWDL